MANFYDIKQPKLLKVRPFFSHLPFITASQLQDLETDKSDQENGSYNVSRVEKKYSQRSQSNRGQNTSQIFWKKRPKQLLRENRLHQIQNKSKTRSNTLNYRNLSDLQEYATIASIQKQHNEKQRSKKLFLVSKLVLMHLQNDKYLPEEHRQHLHHIKTRNEKQVFIHKEMKNKIIQINRNTLQNFNNTARSNTAVNKFRREILCESKDLSSN